MLTQRFPLPPQGRERCRGEDGAGAARLRKPKGSGTGEGKRQEPGEGPDHTALCHAGAPSHMQQTAPGALRGDPVTL